MHLLVAQKGSVNESDEAVDLGQAPADLVFISAADTELSSIASARGTLNDASLSVRVANLMQLSHPMSVDVYAENTVAKSRLIIARVLGGESYFQYGLEKLLETAQENGVELIVLPGDDRPDAGLARFNTVSGEIAERCWDYLKEGGPENMINLLKYAGHVLDGLEEPPVASPLMKAGLWSPQAGMCDLAALQSSWIENAPVVAISFYRALVQSGGLEPIEAIIDTLGKRGINALPVFISSLKDPVSVEILRTVFAEAMPSLVLNATGFAVSSPTGEYQGTVLDERGCPVLQIVLAGASHKAWETSSQGLSSRDLAMNVALPEVDGRVFSRAVAFKDASGFDGRVQSNIVVHKSASDRIEHVADLAARWVRLGQTEPRQKRVGLFLRIIRTAMAGLATVLVLIRLRVR